MPHSFYVALSEHVVTPIYSSYWAPQLYLVNDNDTFTLIPIAFVNTYCKFEHLARTHVHC